MTFAEFCLTHGDAGLLRPAPAGRARQWPKVIEREGHTWVYVHSAQRGSWRGEARRGATRQTSYPRRDAASQVPGFCDACEELLWAFRKTCAYVCRRMLGDAMRCSARHCIVIMPPPPRCLSTFLPRMRQAHPPPLLRVHALHVRPRHEPALGMQRPFPLPPSPIAC
jgi:hypothetical protein